MFNVNFKKYLTNDINQYLKFSIEISIFINKFYFKF